MPELEGVKNRLLQITREFKTQLSIYTAAIRHPRTPRPARWLLVVAIAHGYPYPKISGGTLLSLMVNAGMGLGNLPCNVSQSYVWLPTRLLPSSAFSLVRRETL